MTVPNLVEYKSIYTLSHSHHCLYTHIYYIHTDSNSSNFSANHCTTTRQKLLNGDAIDLAVINSLPNIPNPLLPSLSFFFTSHPLASQTNTLFHLHNKGNIHFSLYYRTWISILYTCIAYIKKHTHTHKQSNYKKKLLLCQRFKENWCRQGPNRDPLKGGLPVIRQA